MTERPNIFDAFVHLTGHFAPAVVCAALCDAIPRLDKINRRIGDACLLDAWTKIQPWVHKGMAETGRTITGADLAAAFLGAYFGAAGDWKTMQGGLILACATHSRVPQAVVERQVEMITEHLRESISKIDEWWKEHERVRASQPNP